MTGPFSQKRDSQRYAHIARIGAHSIGTVPIIVLLFEREQDSSVNDTFSGPYRSVSVIQAVAGCGNIIFMKSIRTVATPMPHGVRYYSNANTADVRSTKLSIVRTRRTTFYFTFTVLRGYGYGSLYRYNTGSKRAYVEVPVLLSTIPGTVAFFLW